MFLFSFFAALFVKDAGESLGNNFAIDINPSWEIHFRKYKIVDFFRYNLLSIIFIEIGRKSGFIVDS